MRKNKVKQMMKDGKPVINGWCAIPSTASAEAMAHQGWDSLTVDMQHGLVDYSNALPWSNNENIRCWMLWNYMPNGK